jgi:hypothetical protein
MTGKSSLLAEPAIIGCRVPRLFRGVAAVFSVSTGTPVGVLLLQPTYSLNGIGGTMPNKFERIFKGLIAQYPDRFVLHIPIGIDPTPQNIYEHIIKTVYSRIEKLVIFDDYLGSVHPGDDVVYPYKTGFLSYVKHLDFEFWIDAERDAAIQTKGYMPNSFPLQGRLYDLLQSEQN